MKNVTIVLALVVIGIAGYFFIIRSNNPQPIALQESIVVDETQSAPKEKEKTDLEQKIEIGEKVLEKGKNFLEAQDIKDSIKRANREEILVYQIGMPKSSPEELWDNYKKLQGFGNIYLVKSSRTSYYLIKHEEYNEEEIKSHEVAAKDYLASVGINDNLKIVDLFTLCTDDDGAKLGKSIKVNKEKVPCYVCK